MQAAFGTTDVPAICERILRTGALQVSDREREYTSGRLFSSIASIVADKCVDAETHRPIPVGVIERSMKDLLGYSVVPGRSAKAQALEVIKGLAAHMPIERAQMRLDVEAPVKWGKGVKGGLDGLVVGLVGAEEWGGGFRAVCSSFLRGVGGAGRGGIEASCRGLLFWEARGAGVPEGVVGMAGDVGAQVLVDLSGFPHVGGSGTRAGGTAAAAPCAARTHAWDLLGGARPPMGWCTDPAVWSTRPSPWAGGVLYPPRAAAIHVGGSNRGNGTDAPPALSLCGFFVFSVARAACFSSLWLCVPLPQSYLVEPKNFNAVQEVVAKESRGSGSVTVSSVAVVHDDEDGEL